MTPRDAVSWSAPYRALPEDVFWSPVSPEPLTGAYWVDKNESLIEALQLGPWLSDDLIDAYAGSTPLAEWSPLAQVYSGHQFGQWAGQLGDGRGLYLGVSQSGEHAFEWHLKGAGQTPYSRFGDGRAVLRSSIREYLGSEYLAALGVPTTRGLCLVGSQTPVRRETMETGATLVRLCQSHLRIGHFEHFYHRQEPDHLRTMIEFAIAQLDPDLSDVADRDALFFERVLNRSARLVAEWMAIGFVHGVMNTDNTALSGETLDYGPYGFLTHYNPDFVINHTDQTGRYAYGQQPRVMQWNLACLAETLVGSVSVETLQGLLKEFPARYMQAYQHSMARRFAFAEDNPALAELLKLQQTAFAKSGTYYPESFALISGFEGTYLSHTAVDREVLEQAKRLWEQEHEPGLRGIQNQITPTWMLSHWMLDRVIQRAEDGDCAPIRGLRQGMHQGVSQQLPEAVRLNSQPPPADGGFHLSCSS